MLAEVNFVLPIRVQRKRIKGWKMPENTIYVGRPTKYGNPYKVDSFVNVNMPDGSRVFQQLNLESSIAYFEGYLRQKIKFNEIDLSELKGKNLACFCSLEKPCHADILLKIVNK